MRSLALRLFVPLVTAGCLVACQAGETDKTREPGRKTGQQGTAAPTTGLMHALSQIVATEGTKRYVAFTDLAALRALAGPEPGRSPYGGLMLGLSELVPYADRIAEPTGIDVKRAERAFQAGQPPTAVNRLTGGLDTAAVGRKLAALGYRVVPGAEKAWAAGPDGALGLDGPLAKLGVAGPNGLNTVRAASDGITYASRSTSLALAPAENGRPVLAADPDFRAVGGCLGPVVAAQLVRRPGEPDLAAAGFRGRTAAEEREVMCVKVPGNDAAAAVARLKSAVATGAARTGEPWADLLREATVENAGPGLVRLTARPGDGPRKGLLISGFVRSDLPRWR